MSHRAVAFSGKQKKQQMQEKRRKQREKEEAEKDDYWGEKPKTTDSSNPQDATLSDDDTELRAFPDGGEHLQTKQKLVEAKGEKKEKDLRTIFEKESKEEVEKRKMEAIKPLEISKRSKPWETLQEYVNEEMIELPKRPIWKGDGKDSFEKEEEIEYQKWMKYVASFSKDRINYYEHNIEVWRQLWRVCERSDVLVMLTDARFPLFHFNEPLYNYIVQELKKPMVLVLNKQDLVDQAILTKWVTYFQKRYSQLKIVAFSAFDASPMTKKDKKQKNKEEISEKRKILAKKRYETATGVKELISVLEQFIETTEFQEKIKKAREKNQHMFLDEEREEEENQLEFHHEDSDSDEEELEDDEEGSPNEEELKVESAHHRKHFRDKKLPKDFSAKLLNDLSGKGAILVGTVGHPNVGKSSLINALKGKKVVSTSRTPGHTKHFQTIILNEKLVLCDCPGLVFPALDRPKALQILCGLFPIAQVREPFSAIRYLSERVAVEKLYGLQFPDKDESVWSPYVICEAFAKKRGYHIARTGKLDVHRAGLEILRDCIDGKIPISWPPPNSQEEEPETENPENVEDHVEVEDKSESEKARRKIEKQQRKKEQQNKKKITQAMEAATIIDNYDSDEEIVVKEIYKTLENDTMSPPTQPVKKSNANANLKPQSKKSKSKKQQKAEEWADKLAEKQRRG